MEERQPGINEWKGQERRHLVWALRSLILTVQGTAEATVARLTAVMEAREALHDHVFGFGSSEAGPRFKYEHLTILAIQSQAVIRVHSAHALSTRTSIAAVMLSCFTNSQHLNANACLPGIASS